MSVAIQTVDSLNKVAANPGLLPSVNFKARIAIRRAAFETIPGQTNIEQSSAALVATFVPRAIQDESNR